MTKLEAPVAFKISWPQREILAIFFPIRLDAGRSGEVKNASDSLDGPQAPRYAEPLAAAVNQGETK
jgi:hypothetical protein